MTYTKTELTTIRQQFDRKFVADGKPAADTMGMDEAYPAVQCIQDILTEFELMRELDRSWLVKELNLFNSDTVFMNMEGMHRYVLSKLDELIDRV